MWSYIIDGLLIGIIVVCIIIGIAKGFFDSLMSLLGTGIALLASVFLGKYVANFFNKLFNFEEFMLEKIEESSLVGENGTVEFFKGTFHLQATEVAKFCVWICSVVILFLAIKLVIFIVSKLFEAVIKNSPTVSGINRLLGMIFGALRGAAIVIVLLALSSVVAQVPGIGTNVYDAIQDTAITGKVYNFVEDFVEKNLDEDTIQGLIEKITSDDTDKNDNTEQGGETGGETVTVNA